MEPFEKDELTDRELDGMLPQWSAPEVPAHLKAKVFAQPWWRRIAGAYIRVPVPVACALAALMALSIAQWMRPQPPPRVIVRTAPVAVTTWRPVTELRPRIIRSGHE